MKLGGINCIPDPRSVSFLTEPQNPTIVMGKLFIKISALASLIFDSRLRYHSSCSVSIRSAKLFHILISLFSGSEGRPSFASLVANVDSDSAKYIAASRVQASRQEMVEDLQSMAKVSILAITSDETDDLV